MPQDPPYPLALAEPDAFFGLPNEERVPHIWECLQYLEWRKTLNGAPVEDLDRKVRVMRHAAQDVAKDLAARLMQEGAWQNCLDMRWPRFNKGSRDPWYQTGCYPPQGLCVPNDAAAWESLPDSTCQVHVEMLEWMFTPAGRHGISDEERAEIKTGLDDLLASLDNEKKALDDLNKANAKLEGSKRKLAEAQRRRLGPPSPRKPYGEA